MLGNRGLTAIGASALNRAYGQPSFAHAQVSGLGLRLWRGLSSLPSAAIRARFASFSGRAVISFSAVPRGVMALCQRPLLGDVVWRLDAGLARVRIHHPTQDDQRRDRDHDIGSKQMAAAEPQTATALAQTAGFGQRNEWVSGRPGSPGSLTLSGADALLVLTPIWGYDPG
jgi:hypothetical protein